LLFPSTNNKPLSDWTLISVVKAQLEAIRFHGREMGPRVPRNTYARRRLLEGRTGEDVSALLGLFSLRTIPASGKPWLSWTVTMHPEVKRLHRAAAVWTP
jgi:hypothetical protein